VSTRERMGIKVKYHFTMCLPRLDVDVDVMTWELQRVCVECGAEYTEVVHWKRCLPCLYLRLSYTCVVHDHAHNSAIINIVNERLSHEIM
jgi:hypothetical protein